MIKTQKVYRCFFLLCFLWSNVYGIFAQDANRVRAQHIYEWFAAGQGDSIYIALNKELQGKLSPVMFNGTFRETEKVFGKLQSKSEWQTENVQGGTLYYSDLKFERYDFRFILAFDADGAMNTIRLSPVPATSVTPSVAYNEKKMSERDITVGAEGFQLPGTLTVPKFATVAEARKVPCIILVHGSGPHDRDETIGPNKPFRDIAWGLAERGIAVIRYDKRTKTYGADCVPAGRVLDYDTEVVDDVLSAVALAKTLPEIASDSIYVLGHSLGGTLAPRIAERSKELAGIIVLAGLARPFEDAVEEQTVYIMSLAPASAEAKMQFADLKEQLNNVRKLGTNAFDEQIPLPLNLPRSYWEFANAYKPVSVAAKLKLPIFVLQGERDYQVTMEDFAFWRFGLWRNKNAFFKSYPKLNHLLQEGTGKATPMEYSRASSVPAYVLNDLAAFAHGIRNMF
ncbi:MULTISPECIES: alpha/beta hydrolase [Bacteroides]|jgi:pimeloyl-ACP methyl ester carboxylesterase|uniref:alpha/beta hydrolase n=1 Tax=Bacteroides TaxID=816 RepID=UPI000C78A7C6|nr:MULTISPECIES: alpha/beta fold hydrolase [Bacteroides]RGM48960.1 alpha/beta fold hydrolase [Bacteroides sp. OM08-11]